MDIRNPLALMFGRKGKNSAEMFSVGNSENGLVIDLYGTVGDWWDANEAQDLLNILNRNRNASNIQLNVHSYGGFVMEGLAILNQLKDHPAQITATVQGAAASMASVIIMAADKVRVHEGSWIMIHEAQMVTGGKAEEIEDDAKWLRDINQQAVDIYHAKTQLPVETIREMMAAETWMPGKQALELGFADELIPLDQAQQTASAQMREASQKPLAFSALDVYHNIPIDCLPAEQTALLSARMKATAEPEEMEHSEMNKPTAEQISNAQAVLNAQKNAPTQEQVEEAQKVLANADENTATSEQEDAPEATKESKQTTTASTESDNGQAHKEIAQLCTLAGHPEKISGYLDSDKSPEEVRVELAAIKKAELEATPPVQQHITGDEAPQIKTMADYARESCKKQGLTPRN